MSRSRSARAFTALIAAIAVSLIGLPATGAADTGTIHGRVDGTTYDMAEADAVLWTWNGDFVDQVDLTALTDPSGYWEFTFSDVPAGEYKVLIEGSDDVAGVWVRTNSSSLVADKVAVTASAAIELPDTDPAPADGEVTYAFGSVAPAMGWDTDVLCVAAEDFDTYTIVAIDCTDPEDRFFITDRLPVGSGVTFHVAPARLETEAAWNAYEGPTYSWGNWDEYVLVSTLSSSTSGYRVDLAYFTDVNSDSKGFDAVSWIGATGIATGFKDGSFGPLDSVTRRQMALFLYRFAGEPEPAGPEDFTDIDETSKGLDAITWLGAEGIASGFKDGSFRPLDSVTRRQMALFLYRFAGEPEYPVPTVSPFTDVQPGDKGYEAIAWLDYEGIATGFKDGSYRPLDPVARRQMALFMYRSVVSF